MEGECTFENATFTIVLPPESTLVDQDRLRPLERRMSFTMEMVAPSRLDDEEADLWDVATLEFT